MDYLNNKFNEDAKVYLIIGNPISHSLSPLMYNTLFSYYNMNSIYLPFNVKIFEIEERVKQFKLLKVNGFNVTIPNKIKIMEFLDEIDDQALKIGAVNTVVNKNRKLIGYNTDINGIITSLSKNNVDSNISNNVMLFGAGGAARSCIVALDKMKFKKVTVTNRSKNNAENMVNDLKKKLNIEIEILDFDQNNILELSNSYSLIINSTSVGMNNSNSVINKEFFNKNMVVFDMVYVPMMTKFLTDAKNQGSKIIQGYEMLIYQAIYSFSLFTNKNVESKLLEETILKYLSENK